VTAVEDRLAEIEARARENWPTSEDVATLAAALRAVWEVVDDCTSTTATQVRAAIAAALAVTP